MWARSQPIRVDVTYVTDHVNKISANQSRCYICHRSGEQDLSQWEKMLHMSQVLWTRSQPIREDVTYVTGHVSMISANHSIWSLAMREVMWARSQPIRVDVTYVTGNVSKISANQRRYYICYRSFEQDLSQSQKMLHMSQVMWATSQPIREDVTGHRSCEQDLSQSEKMLYMCICSISLIGQGFAKT